eukprot:CAMPEP_0115760828 /NCGR_PEP_ID=MMETSP0272-20121206/100197_1 /TAXON_ID=71861 /ORGANISM="Scrippsiella trochoidea, Strain CCMP3099" /LENGTH=122 /DNA_ID=CAMNT_0003206499 /DNA_START=225 /DNA_END=594 /DNA_ORIENTATION=+
MLCCLDRKDRCAISASERAAACTSSTCAGARWIGAGAITSAAASAWPSNTGNLGLGTAQQPELAGGRGVLAFQARLAALQLQHRSAWLALPGSARGHAPRTRALRWQGPALACAQDSPGRLL